MHLARGVIAGPRPICDNSFSLKSGTGPSASLSRVQAQVATSGENLFLASPSVALRCMRQPGEQAEQQEKRFFITDSVVFGSERNLHRWVTACEPMSMHY